MPVTSNMSILARKRREMGTIIKRRYAPIPWGEILPSDLVAQGDPESLMIYRREEHLGLHVRGEYVRSLGMLALRCERRGMELCPLSMAISDTPIVLNTDDGLQSNPRRKDDGA